MFSDPQRRTRDELWGANMAVGFNYNISINRSGYCRTSSSWWLATLSLMILAMWSKSLRWRRAGSRPCSASGLPWIGDRASSGPEIRTSSLVFRGVYGCGECIYNSVSVPAVIWHTIRFTSSGFIEM